MLLVRVRSSLMVRAPDRQARALLGDQWCEVLVLVCAVGRHVLPPVTQLWGSGGVESREGRIEGFLSVCLERVRRVT